MSLIPGGLAFYSVKEAGAGLVACHQVVRWLNPEESEGSRMTSGPRGDRREEDLNRTMLDSLGG